jgi:hypothetical protein
MLKDARMGTASIPGNVFATTGLQECCAMKAQVYSNKNY